MAALTTAAIIGIIAGAASAAGGAAAAGMSAKQQKRLIEAGWSPEDQEMLQKLRRLQQKGRGFTGSELQTQKLVQFGNLDQAQEQARLRMNAQLGAQGADASTAARAQQAMQAQYTQQRAQAAQGLAISNANKMAQNEQALMQLGQQRQNVEMQKKANRTQLAIGITGALTGGAVKGLSASNAYKAEGQYIDQAQDAEKTAALAKYGAETQATQPKSNFRQAIDYLAGGVTSQQPVQDAKEDAPPQVGEVTRASVPPEYPAVGNAAEIFQKEGSLQAYVDMGILTEEEQYGVEELIKAGEYDTAEKYIVSKLGARNFAPTRESVPAEYPAAGNAAEIFQREGSLQVYVDMGILTADEQYGLEELIKAGEYEIAEKYIAAKVDGRR